LTKDYIWQREEFNLELRNDEGLSVLISGMHCPTTDTVQV
jgi:hypothetical protein